MLRGVRDARDHEEPARIKRNNELILAIAAAAVTSGMLR